jgi:hypothetical protein
MCTGIRDLLSDCKADFVGLQETMKKYNEKFFRDIDPSKRYA